LGVGLAAAAADLPGVPVALVELGSSAGLLLGIDRYAVELVAPTGSVVLGDPSSPVRCSGTDRAGVGSQLRRRGLSLPTVAARLGVDLEPVSLDDDEEVRWLEACLWADVPGRVERFRSARDLLRPDPPRVLEGDMVRLLPQAVATALEDVASAVATAHVVVLSSWALSYLTPEARRAMGEVVRDAAVALPALSWVTAEPPGSAPGIEPPGVGPHEGAGTIVGLRRWRGGRELAALRLGSCHPHGQWLDLDLGVDIARPIAPKNGS
ncbi:MAG: DUF2332 family protein, partial [Humibacillus sp.]